MTTDPAGRQAMKPHRKVSEWLLDSDTLRGLRVLEWH